MSLDIQTNDVSNNRDRLIKDFLKTRPDAMIEIQEQRKYERQILQQHTPCPLTFSPEIVATHLSSLDTQKLKSDVVGHFYDANIMEAAACIATSTYFDSFERTREYLGQKIKTIGSPSAYGIAMGASLGDAQNLFVLKAPRNPNNAEELIHESCVAFYGTNQMRILGVPNFAYVYGSFICNAPYNPPNTKDIISFCSTAGGGVSYAVYENIAPAIPIAEFVKTCSAKDFLYNYIQLMMAIRSGNEVCDFTHFDLHGENALMRSGTGIPANFYIKFTNGEYCRGGTYIPTMIDFGMSHIVAGAVHLGHAGGSAPLYMHGIYRDRSFPLYDGYKLLLNCMSEMFNRNKGAFTELAALLYFFNKTIANDPVQSAFNLLIQQQHFNYSLPYTQSTSGINDNEWKYYTDKYLPNGGSDIKSNGPANPNIFSEWINYCRQYCIQKGWEDPVTMNPDVGVPIIGCNGQCVPSSAAELQTVLKPIEAKTLSQFSDIEKLLSQRIHNDLKEIEPLESPELSKARKDREKIIKAYSAYTIKYGVNNNDKTLLDLYTTYIQMTNNFVKMIPNEKYRDLLNRYEALNSQHSRFIGRFISNFGTIVKQELEKYKEIVPNLLPFPMVTLPPRDLMYNPDRLKEIQNFATRSVKYFDTVKYIQTFINVVNDIILLNEDMIAVVDTLTRLKTQAQKTIDSADGFTQQLKLSIIEDIQKLNIIKDKPPTDWYFNTYINLNNFFSK